MVYDCKHDGRRRSWLVAMGNLTEEVFNDERYSSIVALRTLRLALLLGELKGLKIPVGDITSAYLFA